MAASQIETVSTPMDKVKLAVSVVLILAGFVAYFALSSHAGYVRWSALAVGCVAGAGVFLISGAGKALVAFAQDAMRELRKVVWPERMEALQIFLFVSIFVFIMSSFLWLVDKGLEWVLYRLILGWR